MSCEHPLTFPFIFNTSNTLREIKIEFDIVVFVTVHLHSCFFTQQCYSIRMLMCEFSRTRVKSNTHALKFVSSNIFFNKKQNK